MIGGDSVAYAIGLLQERSSFFIEPGVPVYEGMVVGENSRPGDMEVNVTKGKKLTNMRASGIGRQRPPGAAAEDDARGCDGLHRRRRADRGHSEVAPAAEAAAERERPEEGIPRLRLRQDARRVGKRRLSSTISASARGLTVQESRLLCRVPPRRRSKHRVALCGNLFFARNRRLRNGGSDGGEPGMDEEIPSARPPRGAASTTRTATIRTWGGDDSEEEEWDEEDDWDEEDEWSDDDDEEWDDGTRRRRRSGRRGSGRRRRSRPGGVELAPPKRSSPGPPRDLAGGASRSRRGGVDEGGPVRYIRGSLPGPGATAGGCLKIEVNGCL